jgi:ribosomal protein S18 acetylase RimI-like enzyme
VLGRLPTPPSVSDPGLDGLETHPARSDLMGPRTTVIASAGHSLDSKTELVRDVDYDALRIAIASGATRLEITALEPAGIDEIGWSGGRPHLESVAIELQRVDTGEVEYLLVRADGYGVSKGGIDFAKELDAGTIWQLATHPRLEGLGLATRLIHELESRAHERGVNRLRLAVEHDNTRARRLYDHLGYRVMGESEASWEAEATDGSQYLYTTKLTEMVKIVRLPDAGGTSSARNR